MNNKQLKFNTGKYKGKTYLEIKNNTEDLTNIINSNSPGYNKFKTWYKNNTNHEEKKDELITRNRINNLIVDNDAYELRLINKKP